MVTFITNTHYHNRKPWKNNILSYLGSLARLTKMVASARSLGSNVSRVQPGSDRVRRGATGSAGERHGGREACPGCPRGRPGWLSALCQRRGKLLPGLVVAAQVLNSIQERGYKSVGLLATREGVFSWAPRIGFQWVKYINLATLHIPIP